MKIKLTKSQHRKIEQHRHNEYLCERMRFCIPRGKPKKRPTKPNRKKSDWK